MKRLINRIRRSLSTKLGLGILLMSGIIFIGTLGLLFSQSRRLVKQQVLESADFILRNASQGLENSLKNMTEENGRLETKALELLQPDSTLAYPNSFFFLLDRQGRPHVRPDMSRPLSLIVYLDEEDNDDKRALDREMMAGRKGYLEVDIDGQRCFIFYQPQPLLSWSLALVCPESDIFRNYSHLGTILLPLIMIGLLAIILLCRRAVYHALAPLPKLVEQSQLIASGHFDHQITRSRRHDEVGRLQNSFAVMQESLDTHVSRLRRDNAEMTRRNEDLQRASQLAIESSRQKTEFIKNMYHQIRTPLNIVQGFAQVLRDDMSQLRMEELSNIAGMMDRNMVTIYRMTFMLYDSSSTGRTKLFECNDIVSCNEVVRECIADCQRQFPGLSISFFTSLSDDVNILTNYLYLFRSLRELLYNAAKFSDRMNISVQMEEAETVVRFIVQDTGTGISDKDSDFIFVPFTKTTELTEGLGLGLPLTKRHARNLGGDLTLDPAYHDGCRFILELPKN